MAAMSRRALLTNILPGAVVAIAGVGTIGRAIAPEVADATPLAIAKGFWHAHMGWLFERDQTNAERFAPDLVKDPAIKKVDELFWLWALVSLLLPALLIVAAISPYRAVRDEVRARRCCVPFYRANTAAPSAMVTKRSDTPAVGH